MAFQELNNYFHNRIFLKLHVILFLFLPNKPTFHFAGDGLVGDEVTGGEEGEEKSGNGDGGFGRDAAVQPLWGPQDAAVEGGSDGGENSVQCVWGEIQVGSVITRI